MMSEEQSNIVKVSWNRKENTQQAILDKIVEMSFDSLVLVGTKDGEIYTVHSGVEDMVTLTGLLEVVKLNCIIGKL